MKRCLRFALVGICLAMLSALVGGCITVVIPQSSNSPSTTPADLVPAPNEPAQGGSKPIINSFTANPPGITQGASSTLSWNISNASTTNIDKGIGNVGLSGTIIVSPSVTTTYTLTAVNAAGASSILATIVVSAKPSSTPNLSWTGTWDTDFNTMYLIQTGSQVTGEYEHDGGRIAGSVSGYVLRGTWSEAPTYSPDSSDAGDVELTMSPDGNSFTGHWRFGSSGDWDGSWSGTRISP